jgi:hypothetical protein
MNAHIASLGFCARIHGLLDRRLALKLPSCKPGASNDRQPLPRTK